MGDQQQQQQNEGVVTPREDASYRRCELFLLPLRQLRAHLPLRMLYAKGVGTHVVPVFLFLILGVLLGYFETQFGFYILNPLLKSTCTSRESSISKQPFV